MGTFLLTVAGLYIATLWSDLIARLRRYTCECREGYEPQRSVIGFEGCMPVPCFPPEDVEHVIVIVKNNVKLVYKDVLDYSCETGYTLDGKFDGEIHWSVECQANWRATEPKTCQAVQCGSPVAVTHAHVNTSSLVFPQAAKYTCDEGYTVTGSYTGSQEFTVRCESDCRITDASECLPVSCGVASSAPNAQASRNEKFFGDEVKYYCLEGSCTGSGGTWPRGSHVMTWPPGEALS